MKFSIVQLATVVSLVAASPIGPKPAAAIIKAGKQHAAAGPASASSMRNNAHHCVGWSCETSGKFEYDDENEFPRVHHFAPSPRAKHHPKAQVPKVQDDGLGVEGKDPCPSDQPCPWGPEATVDEDYDSGFDHRHYQRPHGYHGQLAAHERVREHTYGTHH